LTEISYNNIGLAYCNNNTISNNTVGSILAIGYCNNTVISNNTINNTLYIIYSNNATISNNTVGNSFSSSSYYMPNGIQLIWSYNITFSGNIMFNGGIGMGGTIDDLLSTKIDTTNLVNGKPIFYYASKTDLGPSNFTNAGQVILVNCSDSILNNLNFSRVLGGISLNYCKNITISNIVVSYSSYAGIALFYSSQINCSNVRISGSSIGMSGGGIHLYNSNNSLISNNYISNMSSGITLQGSHNNTILRNTVFNNTYSGISLYYGSNNNTIMRNSAVNSTYYGINLRESNNNTIYLNNFINNSLDVSSYESTNIWNSSVKIAYTYNNIDYFNYLGNYWDNYTGNDANNDGIGDTSYLMDINKEDNYPLMEPFENYLIPPADDTTAPAAISDLTTSNPTENSVILNWTAPGDDGNTGTASGYIVKYSTSGPINDSNWDSASTYAQSWTPVTAGSKETRVVSGLDPDTQYWFAIKAYDEIPNYGYISNNASEKTLDIIPPVVDSPADITYEEGTTGHIISWNATDNNPGNYIIYREGVEVDSGSWTSGVAITINVDGLTVGSYNYTIKVTDAFNNTATDTVLVDVTSSEVIPPEIAGYSWIVLIFSLYFAISIVILIIKRKITPKFLIN
jgi:parallel beta-helix repeat protein